MDKTKQILSENRTAAGLLASGFLTAVLFAAQSVWFSLTLGHLTGAAQGVLLSALYALTAGAAMAVFDRLKKPDMKTLIGTGVFLMLAMFARTAMLDFESSDYRSFLEPWVEQFRAGGFGLLAKNVGDYNLIYQYFLLVISKTGIYPLYLIKYLTILFDFALALVMMRAAEHFAGEKTGIAVLCTVLMLPTVLTDGACWGQCDSVYVFFIILSLYLLSTEHPCGAAASLAVAFAFKLQTIFFFPIVLHGLLHKKYRLRHAAVFFAAYFVTLIPALIAGRPLMDALSVYANQSLNQYYDRLTYNAPNLYLFFPMLEFSFSHEFSWMRYLPGLDAEGENPYLLRSVYPDLQSAALVACILLTLAVVIYWLIHYKEVTPDMTLTLALFFAIWLPFVMPKIHDRYFFLADLLSVLYAARRRDRRFMPLLVITASFYSYTSFLVRQRPIDERWLALMMLGALVTVSFDLLKEMRAHRAELKGGAAV